MPVLIALVTAAIFVFTPNLQYSFLTSHFICDFVMFKVLEILMKL